MALFEMEECTNVIIQPFEPKGFHQLNEMTIHICLLKRPPQLLTLLTSELEREIKIGSMVVNNNVNFYFRLKDIEMEFRAELP